jgi:hypothetical protein
MPSAYFLPDILLHCLSIMPQLETLLITILFPISDHMERQLLDAPITTRVILPNLRCFQFQGSGTYMEAVVHQIAAPRLEKLNIQLYNELMLSVPHLLQFMNTTKNLRFDSATFEFSLNRVSVWLCLREKADVYALSMTIFCLDLHRNLQVSFVGQIFKSLSQNLSTVEQLSLKREASFEEHGGPEVNPTKWRKLLRSFRYVKTLSVDNPFVEALSRCLESDNGEQPLGLLPELQELRYSGSDDTGGAFTSFIDARQNAGRPVTLNALS